MVLVTPHEWRLHREPCLTPLGEVHVHVVLLGRMGSVLAAQLLHLNRLIDFVVWRAFAARPGLYELVSSIRTGRAHGSPSLLYSRHPVKCCVCFGGTGGYTCVATTLVW